MKKNVFHQLFKSDIFSHFISLKYLPRWVVLAVDIIASIISYWFSDFISSQFYISAITLQLPFPIELALV